jgi:hypothetical protein
MANILMTLNTFEAYSSGCENRNVQDARVHQMLHAKAARARAIMEEALEQLIEADQIKL